MKYPIIKDILPPSSRLVANPMRMRRTPSGETRELAIAKYVEFHRHDPKKLCTVPCAIPATVVEIGKAKWVTYRSDKVDPETLERPKRPIDYIHEHDAGVKLYLPAADVDNGEPIETPEWIVKATTLVKLGKSLGFGFEDEGEEMEAEGSAPLPDLYATPDGRCLLVIQGMRSVLAMMWGGGLGVEGRGIVG